MKKNTENIEGILRDKLSELIATQREKKNWTREELASKCMDAGLEMSDQTIKSYEYGNRIPPLSKLLYLCSIFEMEDMNEFNTIFTDILDKLK